MYLLFLTPSTTPCPFGESAQYVLLFQVSICKYVFVGGVTRHKPTNSRFRLPQFLLSTQNTYLDVIDILRSIHTFSGLPLLLQLSIVAVKYKINKKYYHNITHSPILFCVTFIYSQTIGSNNTKDYFMEKACMVAVLNYRLQCYRNIC